MSSTSLSSVPEQTRKEASLPNESDDSDNDMALQLARTTSTVPPPMSRMREFLFIGLLCSTQLVTQAALLNTLAILHIIGDGLNISDPGVLSWLIAGYSLTVGTFILLSGRLGDVFGYKIMLIIGFVWAGIWSVASGCSVYVEGNGGQVLFIFARVLGGIGPAILLPNALGLLGATYPQGRKKDMVFSLFGACAPTGGLIGGVFAGLWSLVWWPWTFWTFGIALCILGMLAIFILPSTPPRPEFQNLSTKEKIEDLDLLGASVGITAMILFNFAWNQAPGFGWEQVYIYVLLIVGILLFPVFFWIEIKVATKPLIPFDALSADVSLVLGCIACGWSAFGIWVYYFFQILQELRHTSPLLTIALLSPVSPAGLLAAITTGYVISHIGPGRVMFISMCAFLIGNILVATVEPHQIYWGQFFITTLIMPWGMDMSFPAGTLILSNAVKKRHQGMGASLVNTVVNYSISIGVGIAGTVEVHVNNGGKTDADLLKGYRGAMYMAIGMSGLGVLISLVLVARTWGAGLVKDDGGEKGQGTPRVAEAE